MQVPLRRVNQSYVIATSTQVDVSSADLSSLRDDKFVPPKKAKKKGSDGFFEQPEGAKVRFAGRQGQIISMLTPSAMASISARVLYMHCMAPAHHSSTAKHCGHFLHDTAFRSLDALAQLLQSCMHSAFAA